MPEGDTILRTARTLALALNDVVVREARSPLPDVDAENLRGRRVISVEARGKNLLIHFEGDLCLHSHMKMTGSWHVYRPNERWRKPERLARIVLTTDAYVAVCFSAPDVRLMSEQRLARDPALATLGPDVLGTTFSPADAVRGLRAVGDLPIGEALLAQSALAGIGNIYKSEALFSCRLDPFAKVADLDDPALERLVKSARRLMSKNLVGGQRTTSSHVGSRYWVYRRSGEACLVCGAIIAMRRQGALLRSTYFCPHCQQPGV